MANSAWECFLKCGHPQVLLCGLGLLLKNVNRQTHVVLLFKKYYNKNICMNHEYVVT